jgi:hypothetical protein
LLKAAPFRVEISGLHIGMGQNRVGNKAMTTQCISDQGQNGKPFNGDSLHPVWDFPDDEMPPVPSLTRFDRFHHNGLGPLSQPGGHPDWPIAPNSALTRETIAKTPAILYLDGLARGLTDWPNQRPATPGNIRHWQQMGVAQGMPANVSIRTGEVAGAPLAIGAVDIDLECPVLAPKVVGLAQFVFGDTWRRTRANSPRVLLPYRLTAEAAKLKKIRVEFADKDGVVHAVEILLRKNQFIADGIHKTRVPYEWPNGYPVASELPEIDVADINRFLNELDGGDR